MTVKTGYQHIVLNDAGIPIIEESSMKVIELVLDHIAYGWSPEELLLQHPHLSLGQIHSALAYYWDHQKEIELEIGRGLQRIDELQKILKPSNLRAKLKANSQI
jgi:uncharacterized protein (DUF433 family)